MVKWRPRRMVLFSNNMTRDERCCSGKSRTEDMVTAGVGANDDMRRSGCSGRNCINESGKRNPRERVVSRGRKSVGGSCAETVTVKKSTATRKDCFIDSRLWFRRPPAKFAPIARHLPNRGDNRNRPTRHVEIRPAAFDSAQYLPIGGHRNRSIGREYGRWPAP